MEKMSVSLKALCLAPFNAADFKAAVFGGLFGGLASFLVTHLLLELTFSPFFSVFFAILLASIAGLVIQRALAIDPPVPPPALGFADEDDSLDSAPDTSLHSLLAARLGRGPAPDAAPLSDNAWTGRTGSSGPGGRANAADAKQMSTEEFLNDDEEEGAMLFGHNALVA
ncbi:UNVERIFIED_CONTAM: hypothetical protein HHA_234530 [Hammondia hammondi]|eukprot:XP_008881647.1 hypothetical protein HHA_234530 [Hammondia hammondi]